MFRVENNVPEVYIHESRDFQLISRLYDLVFQSSRFSIDSMTHTSDSLRCNENLLNLLSTKVGFFTKSQFTDNIYRSIICVFPTLIKYKGSFSAIILIANLFGRLMNTNVDVTYSSEDGVITIGFEEELTTNTELLFSLLEYVRPTGVFIEYKYKTKMAPPEESFEPTDEISIRKVKTIQASVVSASDVIIGDNEIIELRPDSNWNTNSNIGFVDVLKVTEENDDNNILNQESN